MQAYTVELTNSPRLKTEYTLRICRPHSKVLAQPAKTYANSTGFLATITLASKSDTIPIE